MEQSLQDLQKRCISFFKPLWPGEEKPLVFGQGKDKKPKLMLIGEAPGEQEVLEGKPFVGKAGKNLSTFLESMGQSRENIYITNVVKIRPSKISPKGRVVNRPPNREEIGLFLPFLMEEIALVRPELLVTLGNVPLQAIVGKDRVIGGCHGETMTCAIKPPRQAAFTLPVFPLYHPASIIYNPKLKQVYQQDLEKLIPILAK